MANTVYAAAPFCGFDLGKRSTTAEFPAGTKVFLAGDGMSVGIYVQANGTIAASQTDVAVTQAGQASDGTGAFICTTAFADNEWGWVYGDDTDAGA